MTSVNAPACLLARNNFYRSSSSPTVPIKPTYGRLNDTVEHKQRQVTLWVTMETPPGLMGYRGFQVNIVLGFTSTRHPSTSKPPTPADRRLK